MVNESPDPVERWTAKRRAALVLAILKGETAVGEAARQHGLTVAEIDHWQDRFLLAAENALRNRPKDEEALKDSQLKQLKQKVGELVLDLDILKEAMKGRPFDCSTSARPSTGPSMQPRWLDVGGALQNLSRGTVEIERSGGYRHSARSWRREP